jgi:hypothetical protein
VAHKVDFVNLLTENVLAKATSVAIFVVNALLDFTIFQNANVSILLLSRKDAIFKIHSLQPAIVTTSVQMETHVMNTRVSVFARQVIRDKNAISAETAITIGQIVLIVAATLTELILKFVIRILVNVFAKPALLHHDAIAALLAITIIPIACLAIAQLPVHFKTFVITMESVLASLILLVRGASNVWLVFINSPSACRVIVTHMAQMASLATTMDSAIVSKVSMERLATCVAKISTIIHSVKAVTVIQLVLSLNLLVVAQILYQKVNCVSAKSVFKGEFAMIVDHSTGT